MDENERKEILLQTIDHIEEMETAINKMKRAVENANETLKNYGADSLRCEDNNIVEIAGNIYRVTACTAHTLLRLNGEIYRIATMSENEETPWPVPPNSNESVVVKNYDVDTAVIRLPEPIRRLKVTSNYGAYPYRDMLRGALLNNASILPTCNRFNLCYCYVYTPYTPAHLMTDNDNRITKAITDEIASALNLGDGALECSLQYHSLRSADVTSGTYVIVRGAYGGISMADAVCCINATFGREKAE